MQCGIPRRGFDHLSVVIPRGSVTARTDARPLFPIPSTRLGIAGDGLLQHFENGGGVLVT